MADYPKCGKCCYFRTLAERDWCMLYRTYRDFDSVKCLDYKEGTRFKALTMQALEESQKLSYEERKEKYSD